MILPTSQIQLHGQKHFIIFKTYSQSQILMHKDIWHTFMQLFYPKQHSSISHIHMVTFQMSSISTRTLLSVCTIPNMPAKRFHSRQVAMECCIAPQATYPSHACQQYNVHQCKHSNMHNTFPQSRSINMYTTKKYHLSNQIYRK